MRQKMNRIQCIYVDVITGDSMDELEMSCVYDPESLEGLKCVVAHLFNRAATADWSKWSRDFMGALGQVFKKNELGDIGLRLLPSKPSLVPASYGHPLNMRVMHELEACSDPAYRLLPDIEELLRRYVS
jgi:hypothetical protein